MSVTGNKRKQIIQVVQYLDDRLRELDEEKEELKKYQQLDRQRKCLEYAIYDKDIHDAKQQLAKVVLLLHSVLRFGPFDWFEIYFVEEYLIL